MPTSSSSTKIIGDLITENATVIFILESPHTDELTGGLPLLGDSGIAFANALLPHKDCPAGRQIKDGGIPFSVMNTFQNALKLSPQLSQLNADIEGLVFADLGLLKYKEMVLGAIIRHTSPSLNASYQDRLRTILQLSAKTWIVVCGIISQVYFEYALNLPSIKFAKPTKMTILDHDVEVLYVEHPSSRNEKPTHWTDERRLPSLQKFVSGK